MMLKCVSKLLSSLITSRNFTIFFFKLSSPTQERRMFMSVVDMESFSHYMLFSSFPRNWDAAASFPQLNQDLTFRRTRGYFVNALRGLMCFRLGREVRIYNLTTRQLVNLPQVKSNMLEGDSHMWNYFGHNPDSVFALGNNIYRAGPAVNDEYKVLSIVWSVNEEWRVESETKVLVLEVGASWRNTRSHTPTHRPYSQGISINGVLYYGAWCHGKRCVVISFDLNSEEFNLIELPIKAPLGRSACPTNLMNYREKVAVFEYSHLITEYILDLWVVEDTGKSKWSHKVFVLPCHQLRESLAVDKLLIKGTSRSSGEVRLSVRRFDRTKISVNVIYDLEKNRITQGVVIGPLYPMFSRSCYLQTNLWDDFESLMYVFR
ncbi:unnamed protein product, partial [Arabidopsis halleri]